MLSLGLLALALLISTGAGFMGALLGIGGGVFLVPSLIFLIGVPIHTAIAISIVSVIATSSAAAATYVEKGVTNLRIGMFLETATTIGAVTGAIVATSLNPQALQIVFGLILIYASYIMLKGRAGDEHAIHPRGPSKLNLIGNYFDTAERKTVEYEMCRPRLVLGISYIAGAASGLLGIGGGIIKVPAMSIVGKVPIKVAVATSNFMIGVTAAASAVIYFNKGFLDPFVAAPVALGILVGATVGARISSRVKSKSLRKIFAVVLLISTVKLLLSGLGIA
jgi:uncharacterized membrane protein YfcA